MKRLLALAGLGVLLLSAPASALIDTLAQYEQWQKGKTQKEMSLEPFPAHHIVGNIYYVGTRMISNYLVVTPAGNILINTNFPGTLPLVQKNIEAMGFKLSDTKILLTTHGHSDMAGNAAEIIAKTGAKYEVMDADVSVVETGGKTDWVSGSKPETWWPAAKVDRVLHDGDTVSLGGTVLTALFTPGHTRGTTTWTLTTTEGGKTYKVLISGGLDVHSKYNLVNDPTYPNLADDLRKSFRVMYAQHPDVFLGARTEYYLMEWKYAQMRPDGPNVWVDPAGYKAYVEDREQRFQEELNRQTAAKH